MTSDNDDDDKKRKKEDGGKVSLRDATTGSQVM